MGKFEQDIKDFKRVFEARLRATAQLAVQDTVSLAQRVAKKGGSMRVKTGFLRASIQGNLNMMPSGPSSNDKNKKYGDGDQVAGEQVAVTIAKWDPLTGSVIFIGWTANYAMVREHKDGFMRSAVEVWDRTIDNAARKVKNSGL